MWVKLLQALVMRIIPVQVLRPVFLLADFETPTLPFPCVDQAVLQESVLHHLAKQFSITALKMSYLVWPKEGNELVSKRKLMQLKVGSTFFA